MTQTKTADTADGAQSKAQMALEAITNHTGIALAAGLLPLPIIATGLLLSVQLNLTRRLSQIYSVEFNEELGRAALLSFFGTVTPQVTARLIMFVPVIGPLIGGLSASVLAGASTYATGKVFVQHFESGGTFLTLDPDKVTAYYREQFDAYSDANDAGSEAGDEDFDHVKP